MRFGRVGLAVVVVTSLACSNLQSMMTPPAPPPAPVEVAEPAPAEPAPAAAAGGGGGNVAACKKYVEAVNAAPCMSAAKLDPAAICNDALDMMGCDISKYFDCMATNTKCNGPIPDLAGQATCGAPTCPM